MSLCPQCNSIDLTDPHADILLGPYTSLLEKSQRIIDPATSSSSSSSSSSSTHCEACLYFITILHHSSLYANRREELQNKIVFLYMHGLDVRDVGRVEKKRWGRMDMRFDVCAGEDYEGELGGGRLDNKGQDHLPVDRVRKVPHSLDGRDGLDGIKEWMRDCGRNHEVCRSPRNGVEILPKRLVRISSDVEVPPMLVETSGLASIDYLALSARSFEETQNTREGPTLETLSILDTAGKSLDPSSLPKAFADAFTITRGLGFEYIYIAALCHVSDDPLTLISIFSQATLLLSADNVQSPAEGLIQERAIFNSPPLGINKDRYLRLSCLRNHADLDSSPLSTSGWALIERMLAPRVLHFTKRQLIWECADGWKFEASNVEDKQYGSGMIRGTYQKPLTQPYVTEYLSRAPGHLSEPTAGDNTQHSNLDEYAQRLETWYQIISTLSSSTFRSPLDKSPALSLLAKIIDNDTFGHNLSGVFSKDIAYGLAWARVNSLLTPDRDVHAPSWSWASVHGSISHMYTSYPPSILHRRAVHSSWIDTYTPHLVPHDPSSSLSHPSSSSSSPTNTISLSLHLQASLTSLLHLCEYFQPEFPQYTINLALEQSPIFDCPCCGPRSDDVQNSGMGEFEKRKDHYFAMYLAGDLDFESEDPDQWKVSRVADLLVLREVEVEEEAEGGMVGRRGGDGDGDRNKVIVRDGIVTYERVGLLRLNFTAFEKSEVDEVSIQEKFDGVGWERKTIRLV
ncbi:hypothetical protein BCIN_02g03850 [Botrytis cinerea B05.10]|uniref:Heterokaryon incompatibility domain-containing protein n=1 Tax=Botryotinia fuckeliana (strain B05.10) TaxID=332648 RepID=A0A384J930_BOTFB|nr:hypothetical protein BCIN_02g03850 [Botrytis cinerea B05.10]ATZ47059.1 hypothetical protein BCIN_02g03850 [Botrytis cinerea B05.10]